MVLKLRLSSEDGDYTRHGKLIQDEVVGIG